MKTRLSVRSSGALESSGSSRGPDSVLIHVRSIPLPPRKSALGNLRFEELTQESARLAVSPKHPSSRRDTVSLADAAREPFVVYNREEYPQYHRRLQAVFAKVKIKLRIVEEYDGFSSLIPAIEAGRGVALVSASFIYSAGKRVKLLRLTPEPKPEIFGIAAPLGPLSIAAEKFWQCAKQAALALS
jgi:DNA-binding transcriptional LysR family regulator